MATGDKLFIADKLTLDIVKNNTDYIKEGITRTDSYLPAIRQDTTRMRDDTTNILKSTNNIETKVDELSQGSQELFYTPNIKFSMFTPQAGVRTLVDIQGSGELLAVHLKYVKSFEIQLDDDIYKVSQESREGEYIDIFKVHNGGFFYNNFGHKRAQFQLYGTEKDFNILTSKQDMVVYQFTNDMKFLLPKTNFKKRLKINANFIYDGSDIAISYSLNE